VLTPDSESVAVADKAVDAKIVEPDPALTVGGTVSITKAF
jgi:hypothetical protein